MRDRLELPLLLLLLLVGSSCRGEGPAVRITLTTGELIVARVIDATPDALLVRTSDGREIRVTRDRIATLEDPVPSSNAGRSPGGPPGGSPDGGRAPVDPRAPLGPSAVAALGPASSSTGTPGSGIAGPPPAGGGPSSPAAGRAADGGARTPGTTPAERPAPIDAGMLVSVPAGTRVSLRLDAPLTTETAAVNDAVAGRLVEPLVARGRHLFPAGAAVTGTVVESVRAGRIRDVATLSFVLRTIANAAGERIPVRAATITRQARSGAAKDAATIGGSAAAGGVVGGVVGGRKGAAVGAATGAGAGTAVVLATRGRDLVLPAGTEASTSLLAPITLALTPALVAALDQGQ